MLILGRKFAEQDLYVSLYKIVKHFRLEYPKEARPIDFVFNTLLFPGENTPIRFISRN